jgi:hypothetical protein
MERSRTLQAYLGHRSSRPVALRTFGAKTAIRFARARQERLTAPRRRAATGDGSEPRPHAGQAGAWSRGQKGTPPGNISDLKSPLKIFVVNQVSSRQFHPATRTFKGPQVAANVPG